MTVSPTISETCAQPHTSTAAIVHLCRCKALAEIGCGCASMTSERTEAFLGGTLLALLCGQRPKGSRAVHVVDNRHVIRPSVPSRCVWPISPTATRSGRSNHGRLAGARTLPCYGGRPCCNAGNDARRRRAAGPSPLRSPARLPHWTTPKGSGQRHRRCPLDSTHALALAPLDS
jgi:hypothetical protein